MSSFDTDRQAVYDSDLVLKMARNHVNLFEKVVDIEFLKNLEQVRDYTMLSIERLYDLYLTVNYLNAAKITGDILEIGTWRGGALALALLSDTTESRKVIGFDTFDGHAAPNEDEYDVRADNMRKRWDSVTARGAKMAFADFDECNAFLHRIASRNINRYEIIKGDVKETALNFPDTPLSILRVDCDWYPESLFSLEKFWPMLKVGGFLILDDYGHHSGQKRAFHTFFNWPVKYTHVDYSCITIQKIS